MEDTFAARLRTVRLGLGLTQAEAAARIGKTQGYWTSLETGRNGASLDQVHAIAIALGLDPHQLDERLASTRRRGR